MTGTDKALLAELAAAFMLLTQLPIGWLARDRANGDFVAAVWAYPIVGAVVGAGGAAVYLVCTRVGLPSSFAAVCCLAAIILATGALHEDGLADMADGFGGGCSRARKLEIMRDSRVGSFGVLALVLSFAARGTAIASIAAPGLVRIALVAACTLGRSAMIVPIMLLKPARTDSLSTGLQMTGSTRAVIGLTLSTAVAFTLLPFAVAAGVMVAPLVAALCLSVLARVQIGGYTGDVLGATEVIAECTVLGVLAAVDTVSTL